MMTIPPAPFRKARARKKRPATPAPVALPLTIVSASFDRTIPAVLLTFDRQIDITGIVLATIIVNDDLLTGNLFQGAPLGASIEGPNLVQVNLTAIGTAEGGQVKLTVDGGNGIVAVDDGGTWAGVTNLQLPFPHNHIMGVTHDHEEAIVVALSNPVSAVADDGIQVSSNGVEWLIPESVNISDPMNPAFTFAQDVSGATMWRVVDTSVWHFAPDGSELEGPTSGEIG